MPRGLAQVVARIRALAAQRRVRFTLKAARELSSLGFDATDAGDALRHLRASEFDRKVVSLITGESMYVFKPLLHDSRLYVKLILRTDCVVISFHDDAGQNDEE